MSDSSGQSMNWIYKMKFDDCSSVTILRSEWEAWKSNFGSCEDINQSVLIEAILEIAEKLENDKWERK